MASDNASQRVDLVRPVRTRGQIEMRNSIRVLFTISLNCVSASSRRQGPQSPAKIVAAPRYILV